jgi:dolichol-phosphate mannosyltransferase
MKTGADSKIWVVLPAYNEERALPPLLDSLLETLGRKGEEFSIIVVNDGSKDRTGEVAEDYATRAPVSVLHNDGNKGLAETMRRGLMEALSKAHANDIVVTMDADNTHPAGLTLRMIQSIREGNDVVIASRYRQGSHVRGVSFYRRMLSTAASWLCRILFPIRGVRDYTCGYRAYRADLIQALVDRCGSGFISERGFSCMLEILLRLGESNPVVAEVPLVLRYDLKPGRTKMRILQTILDTLRLLGRRRFGWLKRNL